MPDELVYLWRLFREVSSARQSSGYGPQPLPYTEILAWQTLSGVVLEPWELDAFRSLDTMVLGHYAAEAAKRRQGHRPKR